MAKVKLKLYGTLKTSPHLEDQDCVTLEIPGPITLDDILSRLGISKDLVQVIMRSHRAVLPTTTINPGDRLALFPKEYPFFPDWLQLRRRP